MRALASSGAMLLAVLASNCTAHCQKKDHSLSHNLKESAEHKATHMQLCKLLAALCLVFFFVPTCV